MGKEIANTVYVLTLRGQVLSVHDTSEDAEREILALKAEYLNARPDKQEAPSGYRIQATDHFTQAAT